MKILNKKVNFDYEIVEKYDFGMVLLSSEIKALREGSASIKEAYLDFCTPHFLIYNMFIGNYKNLKHDNRRQRIVLLKKKEKKKLIAKIKKKGYSLVPMEIFWNKRGFAKIKCALGLGKKLYDKRESLKQKELKKEKEKIFKL